MGWTAYLQREQFVAGQDKKRPIKRNSRERSFAVSTCTAWVRVYLCVRKHIGMDRVVHKLSALSEIFNEPPPDA